MLRRLSENLDREFRLIWGFALLLVALVVVFSLLQVRSDEARTVEQINSDNANLARSLEEHTLRTLKSVDQAVLFLRYQYAKQGLKADIAEYVREGTIDSLIFNQLGVIDEHGLYVLSNMPLKKPPLDLSDREHFRVHINTDSNRLFVSKPVLGRASGKWSIQLSRRINKSDGSFAGVAVVSLDPYYFTNLYSDLDLGSQGVATLVGTDGIVRARRAANGNREIGQDVSNSPLMRLVAGQEQGVYRAVSAVDGIERLYAFRKLPEFPLVVLVGVSAEEALAGQRQRAWGYVLGGTLLSVLVIGFAVLITRLLREQRHTARVLEESRQKAEETSRLKSEFLASMSHELRTPLNGIIGYSELLRDSLNDAGLRDFAASVHSSGLYLLDLVNSILDLARIEAGRMQISLEDVELLPLLQQVRANHLPQAWEKELDLRLEVGDDVPLALHCDALRLRQVLNGLVHNGVKFTRTGSVVLHVERQGTAVRFSVQDTGPGIPQETQELIFEKFRQGSESFMTREYGGAGLGLTLARQLVDLMGGTALEVVSQPGQGSTFSFSLPIREQATGGDA